MDDRCTVEQRHPGAECEDEDCQAAECGEIFRDPQGNACRCTREPHPGLSGHIGVVVWEAS